MSAATMPVSVEFCSDTPAASVSIALRFETPAEREARRQALLVEASTWRRLMRMVGQREQMPVSGLCHAIDQSEEFDRVLSRRMDRHYTLFNEAPFHMGEPYVAGSRVIFCELMALECEDEAKALKPSRSSRSSKRAGGER